VLQQLGDFTGALERLQVALELEASQQDAFNRMTILFNIANVHNKAGDFDQALAYYGDSLAVCLGQAASAAASSCGMARCWGSPPVFP
jgi:tetratricopeptide (TPR) repeat protein